MKTSILQNNDINKTEWDKLVHGSAQGSVFLESSFLDAILPGEWGGIIVEDKEGWQALMPINTKSKWGIHYALQPFFTKYWGIAFAKKEFKNIHGQFSWKKKMVAAISGLIPSNIQSIEYNFHPAFDYPLPFFWKNYTIQTKYTSILRVAEMDEQAIFKNYTDSLKNSIRTAEKNNITIIKDSSAESLLFILSENIKSGKEIIDPKQYPKWKDLFKWVKKTGNGFSLTAVDEENNPLAASIYLCDHKYTYAITHNVLYTKRYSDALSLLVHQAILESVKRGLNFDFLGSMIEPVEAFNRRFGTQPTPYLNISKKNILISAIGK